MNDINNVISRASTLYIDVLLSIPGTIGESTDDIEALLDEYDRNIKTLKKLWSVVFNRVYPQFHICVGDLTHDEREEYNDIINTLTKISHEFHRLGVISQLELYSFTEN